MPLPPKPHDSTSKKHCIEETIKIEMSAGKEQKQAVAIAYSHCAIKSADLAKSFDENLASESAALNLYEDSGDTVESAKLKTARRNALPSSDFACPKDRKFPIHDANHVRNAWSRVHQEHTSECSDAAIKARICARAKTLGVKLEEK